MKNVGTSIPGHVLAFNSDNQTAQVQIGIKRVESGGKQVNIPPVINVPMFIYGGQFSVEIQIEKGDEGLIIFSQRCIDDWLNSGGVANNPALRFHDFTDAFFIPGFRSNPNALEDFSNDGIRMRNKTGSQYIWLKSNGDIALKGGELTHNGVNIGSTHRHDSVESGSSTSGTPV